MDKKSKKEILTQWRILGLLQGLKEGGIIEWRCAESFEKMADYLIENNNTIFATTNWIYVLFPIIRRSLTKNKGRLTNVIEPKDLTNFLQNKTINELLDFVKMKKGKKKTKFFVECFERYVEIETLNSPLSNCFSIFDEKEMKFLKNIFDLDYEAEIAYCVSDFFVQTVNCKQT